MKEKLLITVQHWETDEPVYSIYATTDSKNCLKKLLGFKDYIPMEIISMQVKRQQ